MHRRLLVGVLTVASLAAVATTALGFVLADVYRPQGQSSATWEDRHLAGVGGLARRSVLVSVCAATAVAGAIATLVTRSLVAWDLVGLRAVTVVTDVSGYWPAALLPDVAVAPAAA